ncbi:uncharacterized protein [Antedon mediterranea]|uniref:uncharacterized protein n=1 Tax=Antedon mediterranea TaxID=105859 RepID=UPI003AF90730
MSRYIIRTSPGGWSQPGRPATKNVQMAIDMLKGDFQKTSKQFKLAKFEARRYWDQEEYMGTQNYCVEADIGECEPQLVYIEYQQNYKGHVALISFLRTWPWMK